jgi:hypothetical protein
MTGYVAEKLGRRWVAFDLKAEYLRGSLGRFLSDPALAPTVTLSPVLASPTPRLKAAAAVAASR